MSKILLKNIAHLVTMDEDDHEIENAEITINSGLIEYVGPSRSDHSENLFDQTYDFSGHIVLPGLVNTHHHFYQTLTRAVPQAQNVNLFDWLKTLYPIWGRITPDDVFISTTTALAELALSGCTTASDHLYLFPNGSRLDDEIAAARVLGMRFHASRGSMSLGESQGGLPPDYLVENEDFIIKDSLRLIETYHDPGWGSKLQIVLAPCSPFSISSRLMKETAELARVMDVHLHTHLAETYDEEIFCRENFGKRPVELMESLDWMGEDVWFAHAVHINSDEIDRFSRAGCGVAHCPSSNMRLSSGIPPVLDMLNQGVNVGLGVDGSASNDCSNLLLEMRQSLLLSRVGSSLKSTADHSLMTARQALRMATDGGAKVLGRSDIGSLSAGKCADIIAINLNNINFSGALSDPAAALVFCAPFKVDYSFVGGELIVDNGMLTHVNLDELIKLHNSHSKSLISA